MKFSIGELEKLTGMNRTALRYYDAEGLIDPERQENGYRLYSDEDVMSLIQLKQMSAFGIELSEMPGSARNVGIKDVCLSLVRKEQIIEQEIEELYQKLARLRLHAEAYKTCAEGNSEVTESRTVGAYRLYLRENDPDSAKTARIFRKWMSDVPDTYSVVRIPRSVFSLPEEAFCPVDIGIGLLSGAFHRLQETFEPPIEYTPPCKCIQGMIRTRRIDQIRRGDLNPFEKYMEEHGQIPIGDFYGWVVYTPADHVNDCFHISLRIGIG